MKKYFVFILYLLFVSKLFAETSVPGTWNEYFSYSRVTQIEEKDNNIFALTENGFFIYNTESKEFIKKTKLNGLSTVGLTCMAFCDSTSSFVVGYSDGTIDIIQYPSLDVKKISTITNKTIYGSKSINNIVIQNDTAIISTNFGILTFSMRNHNFITTTILGENGEYIPVKSIGCNNSKLYAATTKGIFVADKNQNISNRTSWNKITGIPYENDTINHIAVINDIVYYAHNNSSESLQDSIFKIDNATASPFKMQTTSINRLACKNNNLHIIGNWAAKIYNSDEKLICSVDSINSGNKYYDIVKLADNSIFIGDAVHGLYNSESKEPIVPNCPLSNYVSDIYFNPTDLKLYIVAGRTSLWETAKFSMKTENDFWYNYEAWQINNPMCIYALPNSEKYLYGTFGYGVAQGTLSWKFDSILNVSNSILQKYYYGNLCVVSDITSDKNKNIWILNPGNDQPIVVNTADNEWYSYTIAKNSGHILSGQQNLFEHILIDSRNFKWLTGTNYLTVFYENKTLEDTSDDLLVKIDLSDSEGSIASETTCIAEDLDGEIWVGTNQGIAVHASPSRVFNDRQTISRIKITIDGEVGYLLASESITAIAVDGGNRKWIGTEKSGIFLVSENGTEQILNFTKENSPLPSNNIKCIDIDNTTGEVYIGTENGLVSYITDATAGDSDMSDIMVYPNPVRESYDGDIYIKNIVSDAIVKITNVSGNLVNQITSNGGTAVWDGRNLYGERVKTGVYLIYVSDSSGEHTKITKILFIN